MSAIRSLRVRLILTFVAVSLVGTLLGLLLVQYGVQRAFTELLLAQERQSFSAELLEYYQAHGSWDGLVESLPGGRRPPQGAPPGQGQPLMSAPPFVLADAEGRAVLTAGRYTPGQPIPAAELAAGMPLELGGRRVGTVITVPQLFAPGPAEQRYLAIVQRMLLLSALGATSVALALGWLLARALARPLQELAVASRALAAGESLTPLPVRTRDELGELTAAFNQMSADLARATAQRRQMTADIAHDLRTPLSVLSGYLEALRDGTLKPTAERLDLMRSEVEHLQGLVEDLRTLSLADAGELVLRREPLAPGDLLHRVADRYAHVADQQGVALAVETPAGLAPVEADPERLVQVLGNLVSNALRYTPSGGRITLAAQTNTAALELRVHDTGSGIAPDDLPYIFDRFYRGDKARQEAPDGSGSGLGLAIARALVLAHGGELTAESAPGQGTTFCIALPARESFTTS